MRKRLARGSVINTTKNFIISELGNNNIKAIKRNSLKYDQKNQGDVLLQIKAKLKQSYLKMVKNFEKKAGNIIMQHKNNYSNQVQNNYFIMFVTNITSEKSHRIRFKYTERILEVDPKEILINYYKKHDCYSRLRIMIKAYDNNIIFFPNYFVNESVYSLKRDYKNNKLNLPKPKYKIIDNYKEISNKIIESFIDDNSLNLENKLKNLNDDSSSKSSINKSNSSLNVKKLIKDLNNNLEKKNKILDSKCRSYFNQSTRSKYEQKNFEDEIDYKNKIIKYLEDLLQKKDFDQNDEIFKKINERNINNINKIMDLKRNLKKVINVTRNININSDENEKSSEIIYSGEKNNKKQLNIENGSHYFNDKSFSSFSNRTNNAKVKKEIDMLDKEIEQIQTKLETMIKSE